MVVSMTDLLVVDKLSTLAGMAVTPGVGKEKAVVGWSLGPPQLIKQSSIVSKLFSLPDNKNSR